MSLSQRMLFIASIVIDLLMLASLSIYYHGIDAEFICEAVILVLLFVIDIVGLIRVKRIKTWTSSIFLKFSLFLLVFSIYAILIPEFDSITYIEDFGLDGRAVSVRNVVIGTILLSVVFIVLYRVAYKKEVFASENNLNAYLFEPRWTSFSSTKEMHYVFIENEKKDEPDVEIHDFDYYSALPCAYFYAWLIINSHMSDEYFERRSDLKNKLYTVQSRCFDPLEWMSYDDYVLREKDVSEECIGFAKEIFREDRMRLLDSIGKAPVGFASLYSEEYEGKKLYYCIDFSWDSYKLVEEHLNKLYIDYLERTGRDER